jgi:predicted nucleic acid-binding protein
MAFLCDTNVISEVMKRSPHPSVKEWLSQQEFVFVSVITLEEITCGLIYKDARRQREWFERFVQWRCNLLPITNAIAKRCGTLRGQFRQRGIIRTQADLLIAATAYEHHLVLVTRNMGDFEECEIQLLNPFLGDETIKKENP